MNLTPSGFSMQAHTTQPLSLAPMIDKSHRDWRWMMRQLTRFTPVYTEMITAPAVIHGKRSQILGFNESEKPLVLQLGWDDAEDLAQACRIATDWGYEEVNLNCGCPSQKVQKHNFGAALMNHPERVARAVESMRKATEIPVTVKCRIGIESQRLGIDRTSYEHLYSFVKTVHSGGCSKFIVHARIALMGGLNPRQNREVPPLRYQDVYRLKSEFPNLFVEINGGFRNFSTINAALEKVDGVMIGRLVLDYPWLLSQADEIFFGGRESSFGRCEFVEKCIPYMIERFEQQAPLNLLIQPLMNIFAGCRGSKCWKRALMELVSCTKREPEKFAAFLQSNILETVQQIDSRNTAYDENA